MNIAQRLWAAYHEEAEEDKCNSSLVKDHDPDIDLNVDKEKQDSEDDQNFVYDIAERFLFETDAILALQTSVQAFVEIQSPSE